MTLLADLEAQEDRIVDGLRRLVEAESPSGDREAVARCADVLAEVARDLAGLRLERSEVDGVPYLRFRPPGEAHVALIGHFDTVFPVGTLAERPFEVGAERVHGPGVLDMKCGIVQGLAALGAGGAAGVALLFTGDEELGSPATRPVIEEMARSVGAVLVLEPAAGPAVKVARKGVAQYDLEISGREAHAGLEPEKGANTTVALAQLVLAAATLADLPAGTTVTPTTAASGTAHNTVPGAAHVHLDVRAWTSAELDRVDTAVRSLTSDVAGTTVTVHAGPDRPPLDQSLSRSLFDLAVREADGLGLGELEGARVGGGSDGSFTAGVGTPTLDGLGAVGAGAHTAEEYVLRSAIAPRAALVGAIVEAIRTNRGALGRLTEVRGVGACG